MFWRQNQSETMSQYEEEQRKFNGALENTINDA